VIAIDIPARKLEVLVSDEELAQRKRAWKRPAPKIDYGYLGRYAAAVTSADTGAVLRKPEL
jgi:dihydroxy-acid dehydratase